MREIDNRVAPLGNFHHAIFIDFQRRIRIVLVEQSVGFCNFARYLLGQADLLEGFQHAFAGTDVQRQHRPHMVLAFVVAGGLGLGPGFYRQQAYARGDGFIVQQFGRAHGRAAGRRRQYALAVFGKEDRIDQFRLAA